MSVLAAPAATNTSDTCKRLSTIGGGGTKPSVHTAIRCNTSSLLELTLGGLLMSKWGVLKVYPGGCGRRLEGPYNLLKAEAEARTLRRMMGGIAPSKGIFVVDYRAELAAMETRKPEWPPYSLHPYSSGSVA